MMMVDRRWSRGKMGATTRSSRLRRRAWGCGDEDDGGGTGGSKRQTRAWLREVGMVGVMRTARNRGE
ncbi:pollen-specific leucine-rich repeat extensin-like protein 3 [Iris pallida]|uniref:Pollen-specific leucine-rich repeat extensin-like protein 3 n=1 Tax=Iris pallida TaxID=29817 RepID=A0AAX6HA64_IRIPA|nr:pollen-specific leucine-rich repeat extensin-like protein 3 [Iris pallida]